MQSCVDMIEVVVAEPGGGMRCSLHVITWPSTKEDRGGQAECIDVTEHD